MINPIAFRLAVSFIVFFALCQSLSANNSFTVNANIVSEPSLRGLSEAPNKPALGVNIEWNNTNNFFIGGALQVAAPLEIQQREQSILIYTGWQNELTDDLALGLSASYREFPGSTKEWDYSEFNVGLSWAEHLDVELAYSPNYYEHDTNAVSLALRTLRPISREVFLAFESGAMSFSRDDFESYQYAELGIGYRKKQFISELSYTRTSNEGESLFGTLSVAPKFKLTLSYLLK